MAESKMKEGKEEVQAALPVNKQQCQLCEKTPILSCQHYLFCKDCLKKYGFCETDLDQGMECPRCATSGIIAKNERLRSILFFMNILAKGQQSLVKDPGIELLCQHLSHSSSVHGPIPDSTTPPVQLQPGQSPVPGAASSVSGDPNSTTPPAEPSGPPGTEPCGTKTCKTCELVLKGSSIDGPNGNSFTIGGNFSCKSGNVIYSIRCKKCKVKEYMTIKHTTQKLHERMNGHRSDMQNTTVAEHFKRKGHSFTDLQVCVLEFADVNTVEERIDEIARKLGVNVFLL